MKIQHHNQGKNGVFQALEDEVIAGEMVYTWADENTFVIDHTVVEDEYRGHGVARQMLDTAVDYARKSHLKIIPVCSYAYTVFNEDDSIRDVLKTET